MLGARMDNRSGRAMTDLISGHVAVIETASRRMGAAR